MLALNQIVAEDGVFGKALADGGIESVHIVDALTSEAGRAVQIVIHIGDRSRIGIEARLATEYSGDPGALRRVHADGDLGAQQRVAFRHHIGLRIQNRPVQRMRHGRHHLRRSVARKLRVGIQRDHEADFLQARKIADHGVEPVAPAQQQLVQVVQFPALAFIPHPLAFLRIPAAGAMQQKKWPAATGAVAFIQLADAVGAGMQHVVAGGLRLLGVGEIGQQREEQVAIPIREIANLQVLEQLRAIGLR